jgi:3-oxoacyl-[acyl-carrier protein] reductase
MTSATGGTPPSTRRTGRPEHPVALVTGASGGLGQALALELDGLGYRVALHYHRSPEPAYALAEKLLNPTAVVGGDVASWPEVQQLVATVAAELGTVDVLVNNGAIRRDALLAMQDPADWRAVVETNLIGSFHTCRAALGPMLRQRWGRIINVVSPSALIATAGQTAYGASKSGLIGLTRTLAAEVGRRGVTVNALSPGFMVTGMTDSLPASVTDQIMAKTPVPRFGSTEEVARTLSVFLDSDFMTGQVVSVDGGVSIT